MRKIRSCEYSPWAHSDHSLSSLSSWWSKWRGMSSSRSKWSLRSDRGNLFSHRFPHWSSSTCISCYLLDFCHLSKKKHLPQIQMKWNWEYKLKTQLILYSIAGQLAESQMTALCRKRHTPRICTSTNDNMRKYIFIATISYTPRLSLSKTNAPICRMRSWFNVAKCLVILWRAN